MWQTMHIGLGSIMSPAGRFGGSEDPDASVEAFRTIKAVAWIVGAVWASHWRSITEENVAIACGPHARRWRWIRHRLNAAIS